VRLTSGLLATSRPSDAGKTLPSAIMARPAALAWVMRPLKGAPPIGGRGAPGCGGRLSDVGGRQGEIAMKAISITASFLAIAAALTLSCGYVFAKTAGPVGPGPVAANPVHASGTSAAPSRAGGDQSKVHGCFRDPTAPNCRPGHTQPTCRGPHMGPNGVMIQCD
jgi:hypothetical protein